MRALLRLILLVIVLIGIGIFAFGRWTDSGKTSSPNAETARERGAEIGEKAARAAADIKESAAEAGITAKIKAKMVLDDQVKARSIDVSTHGTTVTLSGSTRSAAERTQALRLARETAGVTEVVDHLRVAN